MRGLLTQREHATDHIPKTPTKSKTEINLRKATYFFICKSVQVALDCSSPSLEITRKRKCVHRKT